MVHDATSNIDGHYIEIKAQIHAIIELKNEFINNWDVMSFTDMINKSTSLRVVYDIIKTRNGIYALNEWKKKLLSRMAREGLLGQNMR